MSAVHTTFIGSKHAYTRSKVPWRLEEDRARHGETLRGKRFGWRLFHYLSGGGMQAFGRTVRQEELNLRRNRFLLFAGALAAVWLLLFFI